MPDERLDSTEERPPIKNTFSPAYISVHVPPKRVAGLPDGGNILAIVDCPVRGYCV
jgi:hypothetical protein